MDDIIITSAKNSTIKHVKKLLSSAKYRREQRLAVAEGAHLVTGALGAGVSIRLAICAESAMSDHEVSGLIEELRSANVDIYTVKDSLFESVGSVHAAVGLIAVFTPSILEGSSKLIDDTLLLDDVQDPGNLGTILRTAAAVGVRKIYLSAGCASVWSPKVMRAGMGAQFELDIYEGIDLISLVRDSDVPVFATELYAEQSIYGFDMSGKSAWLFGNEGQGVSAELLELCSLRVSIPQVSTAVESLNVSAAVAVCLFEQYRQRLVSETA